MPKEVVISSLAFAFFVVCPRMAGMVHLINKHTATPIWLVVLAGSLISIPLLLAMVWIFGRFGVLGAMLFAVATDFCAAGIFNKISLTAGVETLVIAVFVVVGVKMAPLVAKFLTTLFGS
jgi:hypothetical protein